MNQADNSNITTATQYETGAADVEVTGTPNATLVNSVTKHSPRKSPRKQVFNIREDFSDEDLTDAGASCSMVAKTPVSQRKRRLTSTPYSAGTRKKLKRSSFKVGSKFSSRKAAKAIRRASNIKVKRARRSLKASKCEPMSPAEDQSSSWTGDSGNDEVDVAENIDELLDKKSKKTKLTATNVKSIIKSVITNETVKEMMKNVIEHEMNPASPLKEVTPATRMTRSRVKQVMESHGTIWPVSPIKSVQEKTTAHEGQDEVPILDVDFPEEEEEDDDSVPLTNEHESDCDSESFLSSHASDLGSPLYPPSTPGTPGSRNKFVRDLLSPDGSSCRASLPFTADKHIPVSIPPIGPRPRPLRLQAYRNLSNNLAEPAADAISTRTRSKVHLDEMSMHAMEANLVNPTIEADMYETCQNSDDEWQNFINSLHKDSGGTKVTNDSVVDEEGKDDPDYNFLQALDGIEELEKEELRDDRGTKVPKSEVYELLAENYEEAEDYSGSGSTQFKAKHTGSKTKGSLNALSDNDGSSDDGDVDSEGDSEDASVESDDSEIGIPVGKIPKVTERHRLQIQDQLRKHIQLLAQMYVLAWNEPQYVEGTNASRKYLNELSTLAHFYPIINQPNLPWAIEVIQASFVEPVKKKTDVVRYLMRQRGFTTYSCTAQHSLTYEQMQFFASNKVFMFPQMLPEAFDRDCKKSFDTRLHAFCNSEDNLLALGLHRFGKKNLDAIRDYMLPCKTVRSLQKRISNLRSKRYDDNAIKYFIKHGVPPTLMKYTQLEDPADIVPPFLRSDEELPSWFGSFMEARQDLKINIYGPNKKKSEDAPERLIVDSPVVKNHPPSRITVLRTTHPQDPTIQAIVPHVAVSSCTDYQGSLPCADNSVIQLSDAAQSAFQTLEYHNIVTCAFSDPTTQVLEVIDIKPMVDPNMSALSLSDAEKEQSDYNQNQNVDQTVQLSTATAVIEPAKETSVKTPHVELDKENLQALRGSMLSVESVHGSDATYTDTVISSGVVGATVQDNCAAELSANVLIYDSTANNADVSTSTAQVMVPAVLTECSADKGGAVAVLSNQDSTVNMFTAQKESSTTATSSQVLCDSEMSAMTSSTDMSAMPGVGMSVRPGAKPTDGADTNMMQSILQDTIAECRVVDAPTQNNMQSVLDTKTVQNDSVMPTTDVATMPNVKSNTTPTSDIHLASAQTDPMLNATMSVSSQNAPNSEANISTCSSNNGVVLTSTITNCSIGVSKDVAAVTLNLDANTLLDQQSSSSVTSSLVQAHDEKGIPTSDSIVASSDLEDSLLALLKTPEKKSDNSENEFGQSSAELSRRISMALQSNNISLPTIADISHYTITSDGITLNPDNPVTAVIENVASKLSQDLAKSCVSNDTQTQNPDSNSEQTPEKCNLIIHNTPGKPKFAVLASEQTGHTPPQKTVDSVKRLVNFDSLSYHKSNESPVKSEHANSPSTTRVRTDSLASHNMSFGSPSNSVVNVSLCSGVAASDMLNFSGDLNDSVELSLEAETSAMSPNPSPQKEVKNDRLVTPRKVYEPDEENSMSPVRFASGAAMSATSTPKSSQLKPVSLEDSPSAAIRAMAAVAGTIKTPPKRSHKRLVMHSPSPKKLFRPIAPKPKTTDTTEEEVELLSPLKFLKQSPRRQVLQRAIWPKGGLHCKVVSPSKQAADKLVRRSAAVSRNILAPKSPPPNEKETQEVHSNLIKSLTKLSKKGPAKKSPPKRSVVRKLLPKLSPVKNIETAKHKLPHSDDKQPDAKRRRQMAKNARNTTAPTMDEQKDDSDVEELGEDDLTKLEDVESQDEEDTNLNDLMAACSTVRFSGRDVEQPPTDRDKQVSKAERKKEVLVEMLAPNIIEADPLKDERDTNFAQDYMTAVEEALGEDEDKYQQFLSLFNGFRNSEKSPVQLYNEVKEVLSDHPALVADFAQFLTPEQAMEAGCYLSHQEFISIRTWLNKVEIFFRKNPNQIQKMLRIVTDWWNSQDRCHDDLMTQLVPVLKGEHHLLDEIQQFFPNAKPPACLMTDFEEIILTSPKRRKNKAMQTSHCCPRRCKTSVSTNSINNTDGVGSDEAHSDSDSEQDSCDTTQEGDEFETIILPDTKKLRTYKTCTCSCHCVPGKDTKRKRHCKACGLRVIDGKLYMQAFKSLRPMVVHYEDEPVTEDDPLSNEELSDCESEEEPVMLEPIADDHVDKVRKRLAKAGIYLGTENDGYACHPFDEKYNDDPALILHERFRGLAAGQPSSTSITSTVDCNAIQPTAANLDTVTQPTDTVVRPWTENEDRILLETYRDSNSSSDTSKVIADTLNGSSTQDIENRYNDLLQNMSVSDEEVATDT